jgi:hypothetical protein
MQKKSEVTIPSLWWDGYMKIGYLMIFIAIAPGLVWAVHSAV